MKITKNLTFSQALANIKLHFKAVIAIAMIAIIGFFALVFMGENHIISESGAVAMGQGLFLGVVFALVGIISGKFNK